MPRKPALPARSSAGRKSVPLNHVTSKPGTARRKPYGEEEEIKPEEELDDFDDDEDDDEVEDIDDEDVEDFEDEDFDDDELDDFSDDDDE